MSAIDHDAVTTEVTQEALQGFLRAGGVVSLAEWLSLDGATQEALERAGSAVRAELVLAIAAAVRSPDGAAAVARVVDGGRAEEDARVEGLMTRALRGRMAHG